MTYGWAILIIALTLGVLYSLGIMNPKNFLPRAPPGSCFVFRPNGPGTTDFVSLQGTCGYLPMYVASFNGVNSYINVPYQKMLSLATFTIVVWVYPSNVTKKGGIVAETGSGWWGQRNYRLCTGGACGGNTNESKICGEFTGSCSSVWTVDVCSGTLQNKQWYHVVYNYNGTTEKMYINGILTQSYTYPSGCQVPMMGAWNVSIGRDIQGPMYFNGSIANVQIYNTALTPQEIQYLYQQGLGGGPVRLQNLVAWWPLNGDAKDYSGNNLHGAIYGVTFVQNYNPP
jgi:hypothetical protein